MLKRIYTVMFLSCSFTYFGNLYGDVFDITESKAGRKLIDEVKQAKDDDNAIKNAFESFVKQNISVINLKELTKSGRELFDGQMTLKNIVKDDLLKEVAPETENILFQKEPEYQQPGFALFLPKKNGKPSAGSAKVYAAVKITTPQTKQKTLPKHLEESINIREGKYLQYNNHYSHTERQLVGEALKEQQSSISGRLFVYTKSSPCVEKNWDNGNIPCTEYYKLIAKYFSAITIDVLYSDIPQFSCPSDFNELQLSIDAVTIPEVSFETPSPKQKQDRQTTVTFKGYKLSKEELQQIFQVGTTQSKQLSTLFTILYKKAPKYTIDSSQEYSFANTVLKWTLKDLELILNGKIKDNFLKFLSKGLVPDDKINEIFSKVYGEKKIKYQRISTVPHWIEYSTTISQISGIAN